MLLFLQLWISRIAAATREHGMKYPALMHNLTKVSCVECYCVTPLYVLHAVGSKSFLSFHPYRPAFSSTDASSAIWLSQSHGRSSHLRSWRELGNRKASERRWVTAKSLLVSSPVLFCCSKGLDTVTGFQSCGLKNSGDVLETHTPPFFMVFIHLSISQIFITLI